MSIIAHLCTCAIMLISVQCYDHDVRDVTIDPHFTKAQVFPTGLPR